MLGILINKAKEDGKVSGVVPDAIDGGLSILQYVMIHLCLWNMT